MRFLIVILMMGITGCSMVSRADYDTISNKLKSTSVELSEATIKINELEREKFEQSERFKSELKELSIVIQKWIDRMVLKVVEKTGITVTITAQEVVFGGDYQGALVYCKFDVEGQQTVNGFLIFLKRDGHWRLAQYPGG